MYPLYRDVDSWMAGKEPLMAEECAAVVEQTAELLIEKYGVATELVQFGLN
jgi:hypothetical protein